MHVEDAIVEHLAADTAIAALVGARVYQLILPQEPTLPAIRVQLISEPGTLHLRGVGSLYHSRVQIDAVAREYDAANPNPYGTVNTLADAIDAAMAGQAWDSQDSPTTVRVLQVQRADRMPIYDPEEKRQVRVVQDYLVWWAQQR